MSENKDETETTLTPDLIPDQTPESDSSTVTFNFKKVSKKPPRKYRKGSKYDTILDTFLKGTDKLVTVEVDGRTANYIRTQLKKRIESRDMLNKIDLSVVNDLCYLEKL